jgi:hypothetical protein
MDGGTRGPVCDMIGCRTPTTQDVSVFSIDPGKKVVSDASYKSCQAFSAPSYTPGVCPNGHTVAEVTEYQTYQISGTTSGNVRTYWQASCCRRSEYTDVCL